MLTSISPEKNTRLNPGVCELIRIELGLISALGQWSIGESNRGPLSPQRSKAFPFLDGTLGCIFYLTSSTPTQTLENGVAVHENIIRVNVSSRTQRLNDCCPRIQPQLPLLYSMNMAFVRTYQFVLSRMRKSSR
ncbi:hypothetical protein AA313_de0202818 [Arthrobotrys entomopaga]|nr:hypothetical protein AA313_de0202818 [Arthrobotrys entomopaga]